MLMDDQPELGGSLLSGSTSPGLAETIEGKPALEWVADVEAELVSGAECTVLNRTTAFGAYDANYVIAVQNRTDHLSSPAASGVSRQRIWHVRANQVVLAPGAHERPLVFENNDRPGIMLASAVRSYLNRYAVAAGQRVVIGTTNDSAYALAADLRAAGVKVAAVVDARPRLTDVAAAAAESGTRVLIGSAVANTATAAVGRRRPADKCHRPQHQRRRRTHLRRRRDRLRPAGRLRRLEPAGPPPLPAAGQAALGRGPGGLRAEHRGPQPADHRLRARQLRTG